MPISSLMTLEVSPAALPIICRWAGVAPIRAACTMAASAFSAWAPVCAPYLAAKAAARILPPNA